MYRIKFFLPLIYFISTRIASFPKLVSWGIIYIVPTAYIALHYSPYGLPASLLIYLLQLLIIYNYYEVGYIENDTETIKKETNPTLRLAAPDFEFYERNKYRVYGTRLLLAALLSLLLLWITGPTTGYVLFCATTFSLLVIYNIYNRIRNRFTLVLHFLLVSIRFLSYPLLFAGNLALPDEQFLFLFAVFPVINLLERASVKRFGFTRLQFITASDQQLNAFRMWYYLLATLVLLAASWGMKELVWMLWLFVYYAAYRSLIVIKQRLQPAQMAKE